MSSDALFQPNPENEKHFTEQKQLVEEASIGRNETKKNASEKFKNTREELEEKARRLSAMRLQHNVEKKREEQMLKQMEELLSENSRLGEQLAKIKRESKEEEETFLEEISRFNSGFSLVGNRETLLESQIHTELLDLEREEEALCKEMELMSHTNAHMRSVEEEKTRLLLELQRLENMQKDLDWQLSDATAATESLRSEDLLASQKPLTDATCLRLKDELQTYEAEEELEQQQDELSSQLQLLQSKLDGSQDGEQH